MSRSVTLPAETRRSTFRRSPLSSRRDTSRISRRISRRCRATRGGRYKQLIELVAFHNAEAGRRSSGTGNAYAGKCGGEALPEARLGTERGQLRGNQVRVRLMPGGEPDPRQLIEIRPDAGAHDNRIHAWRGSVMILAAESASGYVRDGSAVAPGPLPVRTNHAPDS